MRRLVAALCVAVASTGPAAAQSLICLGFLAGCCLNSTSQPQATALEGASWRLVSVAGLAPATLTTLERGVTARFEDGRVSGFSGCNSFTGPYVLEADRLRIGQLAGTMMACPEPAMTVERAVLGAMTGASFVVAIAGDHLTLTADSGARVTFVKQPPETPEGGTWEVTGYNNGRQAVVGPMTGTRITVAFEQGTVAGEAGCNTFRATYSTDGSRIAVGKVAATRKMCEAAVMAQEGEFLAALESASTWSIDAAGLLHLHRPDGERVLVAGPRRR